MTFDVETVDVTTGVTLEYVERGDPSGIPVVLLHGVSDSWRSFEMVLPHLPDSVHAFAVSQRGHGDSSRPQEGYDTRQFAADAVAFLDAVGLRDAVVVGHSLGGTIAQRTAIDHPERVRGVVLASAFHSLATSPASEELWEALSGMEDPVDPEFVREFQRSTIAQSVPDDFFETVVRESLKLPARVWRAVVRGTREEEFSGQPGKIAAPTLLMWGDRDEMVSRADQEAQLHAIPDSELLVYEGIGHALHWEDPERFAGDVGTFADRCGPARSRETERVSRPGR